MMHVAASGPHGLVSEALDRAFPLPSTPGDTTVLGRHLIGPMLHLLPAAGAIVRPEHVSRNHVLFTR